MSFLGACGSAVTAAGMSAQRGCMGACVEQARRCAPAAADALWSRVARACSARADDGCVVGFDRLDVWEHRRDAGRALSERCAMYMYTIESVPRNGLFITN